MGKNMELRSVLLIFSLVHFVSCTAMDLDGRVRMSSIDLDSAPQISVKQSELFGWSCFKPNGGLKVNELNGYQLFYLGPVGRNRGGIQERLEIRGGDLPCDFFFTTSRSIAEMELERNTFKFVRPTVFRNMAASSGVIAERISAQQESCEALEMRSTPVGNCGARAVEVLRSGGVGIVFGTFINEGASREVLVLKDEVYIDGVRLNDPS